MKRSTVLLLAALVGLVVAPHANAWFYGETVVYREPVVVERVYAPPVYSYETTTIGVPCASVGITRTYVEPAPVYVAPAPVVVQRPYFSFGIGPFYGPRHYYRGGYYGHGGYYGGHRGGHRGGHDGGHVRVRIHR